MNHRLRHQTTVVLLALGCITYGPAAAFAQPAAPTAPVDLSEFVADPSTLGDGWALTGQGPDNLFQNMVTAPSATAGYSASYRQGSNLTASVGLYAYKDRSDAEAGLVDREFYWGHGNTTFKPLTGLGDGGSYRAYGVGKGANSGITFIDGNIDAFVRTDGFDTVDEADNVANQLASAEDSLLQNAGLNVPAAAAANVSSLSAPFGVAVDQAANLYVADLDNNRVIRFPAGTSTPDQVWGQPDFASVVCNQGNSAPDATTLCRPSSVAVDAQGNLYVLDSGNYRVVRFPAGSFTADRQWGRKSFTDNDIGGVSDQLLFDKGGMNAPPLNQGIALDGKGNLYVDDTSSNRVLRFLAGSTTADMVWGQPDFTSNTPNHGGVSAASLSMPSGLAVDAKGNVFVSDLQNERVLRFPAGSTTADWVWGEPNLTSGPTGRNRYAAPEGLATDSAGRLYVSAPGFNNGSVLRFLSGSTTPDVQLAVPDAQDIAVDTSGNMYVAEPPENRVQRFPAGSTTVDMTWGGQ